jgi:hypothetical protein
VADPDEVTVKFAALSATSIQIVRESVMGSRPQAAL